MTGLARIAGAFGIGALLLASPAAALDAAIEPYKMVRTLQMLQDQTAFGSATAEAARSELLAQIAARFGEAGADLWKDPRNGRAALVYVLSGGHPEILQRLIEADVPAGTDPKVLRGALAYVEGRDIAAGQLLGSIDVRSVHPSLAGQLALIQAALLVLEDPEKAVELLDFARLMAPGTLIEESALRREITVVGELGDTARFQALSARYVQRFSRSIYAETFRRRFAALAVDLGLAAPAHSGGIEQIFEGQPVEHRRTLYLSMAQYALLAGKSDAAAFMAGKAKALAKAGGIEAARAALYAAAAAVVTSEVERAAAELKRLQHQDYSEADVAIREAALAISAQVTHWPEPPAGARSGAPANGGAEPALATIGRAETMILEVDRLLGGSS